MHLRDYLNDIPLKALKTVADTLGIDVEYRARIKLMNAIDRAFWDTSLTERLMEGLDSDKRLVLSIIAFSYSAGVTEQALVRKVERLTGMKRKDTLRLVDDLIPLALVGGIHEERNVYFCPDGIAAQIRRKFIGDTVTPSGQTGRIPAFSPSNLLEDIYSFLASVYKDNLPLTLMGKVRKTSLDRIFNGSPTCGDNEPPWGQDHRNSFVVEYCRERDLVNYGRRSVSISPKISGWLSLTTTDRINDIVSYALTNRIQDAVTIITLSGILSEMERGYSFTAQDLAEFFDNRTEAPGGRKRLDARLRDVLTVLNQLGFFAYIDGRFVLIEAGERFFRGGRLPQDEKPGQHFTVQPNFEVIAGPEFLPQLRFVLELLADRRSRDTVLTFFVNQRGIARARERGMTTDEIIRFFHDHSRNPLPQNVRFSIEQWANSYGTVFFENLTLMRCRTAEICDSVVHMPDIAPYIMERLSDTAIVVSTHHVAAISEHLKKSGFLPEAFGETEPDSVLNGSGFTPAPISDLVAKHAMPDIHHNFIFPEHLLSEGEDT